MVSNLKKNNEKNLLEKVVGLTVLLGAALYFTGWTYRWAYYSFFQVEVTTLNLPLESFYIAAFHVLVEDVGKALRTAIAFILAAIGIHVTLWALWAIDNLVCNSHKKILDVMGSLLCNSAKNSRWWSGIAKLIKSIAEFNSLQFRKFIISLVSAIVIALWVINALFGLGQSQGDADAWTDAVNETSLLPVVTIVIPSKQAALGRIWDNPTDNPHPSDFRIIGNLERYKELLMCEREWRLLIDRDGYFYIFPALPSNSPPTLRPPVVIIYESVNGEHLMIISPKPSN